MHSSLTRSLPLVVSSFLLLAAPARAAEWFVAVAGNGKGTAAAPFGRIQDAIAVAQPGDVVTIAPGTYPEALRSVRSGTSSQPIRLRARDGRGSVVVSMPGRVLTVSHGYVSVEGLVLDGQYGASDLLRIETTGTGFTLRRSEVRRSSRDGVDMGATQDVLIEDTLIHHTLNAAGGRTDAHGIVAGAVRRLTIRNTEIHTFSGDAFQVDPGRAASGWNDVVIEGCKFWLAPLPSRQNGFPAGTVAGENAVDTKASGAAARARLTIKDTEAFGFRRGLIGNMAAFNLKENVDVVVDRVTVYNSEIAFRLRGPGSNGGAVARVQNAVVHSVDVGFRYEDDIDAPKIYNATLGSEVSRPFVNAASDGTTFDVRNTLVLASSLPAQAAGPSNRAVPATAFVDAARHNYQLREASPAIDAGVPLAVVTHDRQGTTRPQGSAFDVGAYERIGSSAPPSEFDEVVLHAWKAQMVAGNWSVIPDNSAAGGARLASVDEGAPKVKVALATPQDYFEMSFYAEKGKPYRLWIRGRATRNERANDAVFVQFSGSVKGDGAPVYRIGTTSGVIVNLQEDCSTCILSAWGWQDTSSKLDTLGPAIYFAQTGLQTLRVQIREDGFSIDQIVLSPSNFLTRSPGATTNDRTILNEGGF